MPVWSPSPGGGYIYSGDGGGLYSPYGNTRAGVLRYLSDLYGGKLVGETFDVDALSNQTTGTDYSINLISGRQYMSAIWVPKTYSLSATSGFGWYQITQGSYTPNNFNGIALYSTDGSATTLTLRMSNTATIGTLWSATASATAAFQAFTGASNYTMTPGLYWLSILYSNSAQVTAPAISGLSNLNSAHVNLETTALPLGINFAQSAADTVTTFPATVTVPGVNRMTANYPWLYLRS